MVYSRAKKVLLWKRGKHFPPTKKPFLHSSSLIKKLFFDQHRIESSRFLAESSSRSGFSLFLSSAHCHLHLEPILTIMVFTRNQSNSETPPGNPPSTTPLSGTLLHGNPPSDILPSGNTNPSSSLQSRLDQLAIEKAELENAKLRQEIKESEARTAAISNPSHSASATGDKSEQITGEIPPEVLTVAAKFGGLSQDEIAKIFNGKFKPVNLYKLRHLQGIEDMYREDRVKFDGDVLNTKKAIGTMKDYGSTPTIWSEAFLNYSQIMVSFFGSTTPDLFFALGEYHREVLDLAKVYEWRQAVLPLAIDYHTHITESSPTTVRLWTLPQRCVARYCSPLTVLGTSSRRQKRSKSPATSSKPSRGSDANNQSIICNGFNGRNGCSYPSCKRDHKCKECGSRDHGESHCWTKTQR